MPLKIRMEAKGAVLELDGDFTVDDKLVELVNVWTRVVGEDTSQAEIDQLTQGLRGSTNELKTTVDTNQPTPAEPVS